MENEVQKHMKEQRLKFADECKCERCIEIEKDNRIQLSIKKFEAKYPEIDFKNFTSENWNHQQRVDAIEMVNEILDIHNE